MIGLVAVTAAGRAMADRLAPLPDGTHRLAATNPVHVVWGIST